MHTITILNAVEAHVDLPLAELIKPCLSYASVFYRPGIHHKIRTETKKNTMIRVKTGFTFYAGLLDHVLDYCRDKNLEVEVVDKSKEDFLVYEPKLPGITFRKDQLAILDNWLDKLRGILISPTGSGKTVLGAACLSAFDGEDVKILWLCHTKDLMKQAKDDLNGFGFADIGRVGDSYQEWGHRVTIASRQSFKKLADEQGHLFDIVVVDECFAKDTRINTINGLVEIQNIKIGDFIYSETGVNRVNKVFVNKVPLSEVIKLTLSNGKTIICSSNHLFKINDEWIKAKELLGKPLTSLNCGDMMHNIISLQGVENGNKNMSNLWNRISNTRKQVLFQEVCLPRPQKKESYIRKSVQKQSQTSGYHFRTNEKEQPFPYTSYSGKTINHKTNERYPLCSQNSWWKRYWSYPYPITSGNCIRLGNGSSDFRLGKDTKLPNLLQTGYRKSETKNRYRSERMESQHHFQKRTGYKKERETRILRVENIEFYQRGNNDQSFHGIISDKENHQGYVEFYDLEINNDHNYFVENILVHNCHHVSALDGEYAYILSRMLSPIRLGLTASDKKIKEGEAFFASTGLIGPIVGEYSIVEAIEDGVLAIPKMKMLKLPINNTVKNLSKYSDVYRAGVVEREDRNNLIAVTAKKHVDKGETVLIMVTQLAHADNIMESLFAIGIPALLVEGLTKTETRDKIKVTLNTKEIKCVVATVVWKEGINIPSLDVVILASGGKDPLQALGRGLRKTKDKDYLYFYDFFDPSHRYLIEHFGIRLCFYLDHGWL